MTRDQANTFLAVILEVVSRSPGGAPSGPIYAALIGHLSLEDYQSLLAIAESTGLVTTSRSHVVDGEWGSVIADYVHPETGKERPLYASIRVYQRIGGAS